MSTQEVKAEWPTLFLVHLFQQVYGYEAVVPLSRVFIGPEARVFADVLRAQSTRSKLCGPVGPQGDNHGYKTHLLQDVWVVFDGLNWQWRRAARVDWLPSSRQFLCTMEPTSAGSNTTIDVTVSEAQLHTWKLAMVSELARSRIIQMDFTSGPSRGTLSCRFFTSDRLEKCWRVTYDDGNQGHDMSETDLWHLLIRTECPWGARALQISPDESPFVL